MSNGPKDGAVSAAPVIKTPEQEAGKLYYEALDAIDSGSTALFSLALHIRHMVEGTVHFPGPLWQVREFPDGPNGKVITLDKFEDYLLKPAREGLGYKTLLNLHDILKGTHTKEADQALEILKREIPDFEARVEKERAKATARLVETAKEHGGARDGAGRKSEDNQGENFPLKKERKTGSASPERVIARLKRDAATDPNAQSLLDTLSAGDISARQAALQMGYIKPADPARIVEKQREKLPVEEQVAIWQEWGRALPDEALDRVEVATEALLALTDDEVSRLLADPNVARLLKLEVVA